MSSKFVGRQKELEQLQGLWDYKIARFVVIKGRLRIGKSRPVEEFAQGSPKKTLLIVRSSFILMV
jgi:AAA+ ATPase superfamily predicted ATPase